MTSSFFLHLPQNVPTVLSQCQCPHHGWPCQDRLVVSPCDRCNPASGGLGLSRTSDPGQSAKIQHQPRKPLSWGFVADLMREVTAQQQRCNLEIHQCITLGGLETISWYLDKFGLAIRLWWYWEDLTPCLKNRQWQECVWEFHPSLLPTG